MVKVSKPKLLGYTPPKATLLPCNQPQDFRFLRFGRNHAAALFASDVGVFEAVAGDGADDAGAFGDLGEVLRRATIGAEAFEEAGDARGTGGFDEDAFVLG